MLHASKASSFLRWCDQVQGLRRQRRVLEKVTRRMRNSAALKTFATWEGKTKLLRRQRAVMHKVAVRMKSACICAAFERWCENGTEKRSMIAKSTRVVLRWRLQSVVRCLEAWREHVVEEERKRNIMARMMNRMLNKAQASSFDRWSTAVSELARQRDIMERILQRMINTKMSAAYQQWSTTVYELVRQRNIMDRILKRMLNAKMCAAYERWRNNVVENKQMVAKARKVVGRWVNQCLARTMDAWHEITEEEARRRNVMSRILQRMQNRTTVLALELWYCNTIAAKAREESMAARNAEKETYEEEMLRLKELADRAREEQEFLRVDLERKREELEIESEKRQATLIAEFERERQEEASHRERQEADVRSQLEALEAELAREVRRAEQKIEQLEENDSGFCRPGDIHFKKPQVPMLEHKPPSRSRVDSHGEAYDANGRVYGHASGRNDMPVDQLLEAQTRLAELRAHRSGLGAKIHLKLAEVNLNLEEHRLDLGLKSSMVLNSKALIRDSHASTARKLKQLEKELKRAEHPPKSKPLEDHPSLKHLKAVRPQQGPHSHFEGAPVLSSQLPKGYSVASNPSSILSPRNQEIQQLIDGLKRPRQTGNHSHTDEQSAVCGRPGWFHS